MSKLGRRWIELDTGQSDHLRASDIPTTTSNIQTELDAGKLKATGTDTAAHTLDHKLIAGSNVSLSTITDPTYGQQLKIDATASTQVLHNEVSRYQMVSTSGLGVSVTSSSPVVANLSWSRSGTDLVINHAAHGRSVGERAILRSTNLDYQTSLITAVTTDTFTVTTTNTGGTSGTSGAYSLGFTYAHNASAGSITAGTLTAPSGGNVVLLSLRLHLANGTRSTTTYTVTIPKSSTNGGGDNTSSEDLYPPMFLVRTDADAMTAIAATIAKNVGGDLGSWQLANLGATTTGLLIMLQF